VKPLLSDEHFSVDETLIEAWASQRSIHPRDGSGKDGSNFHGQTRKNDTHQSTTDPDSRLYRKAAGREAMLAHMLHLPSADRRGEKFVDTASIGPVYHDAAYYLVPDGDAGEDVYAVLREAIAKTRKTALSRPVIAQRERTIALRRWRRPYGAHALRGSRPQQLAGAVRRPSRNQVRSRDGAGQRIDVVQLAGVERRREAGPVVRPTFRSSEE
jgi:hypothetical protein